MEREAGKVVGLTPITATNYRVFDVEALQKLWEEALVQDSDHVHVREAIASQDTTKFPSSLGL